MRNKLPVYIENRELPMDEFNKNNKRDSYSYGYVNFLYLASLIITIVSVLSIVILKYR